MKILLIAEAQSYDLRETTRRAITLARAVANAQADATIEIALFGDNISSAAEIAAHYAPTFMAEDSSLAQVTADRYAAVMAHVATLRHADVIIAASTTQAKDCVTRAAGLLEGAAMVSDAIGFKIEEGRMLWQRNMYAGKVRAWVATHGQPVVVTALPAAFAPAEPGEAHAIETLNLDYSTFTSRITVETISPAQHERPDPSDAAIVVSGGRAFRTAEDYERLIGGLADKLGAATGCSRAAVDAGIAPNENQIGQTGKIVAPKLYLGIGVSGAIQHLTGMVNSSVIAVINTDETAPLLAYADFALIADAYEAIPEMIGKL